MNLIQSNLFLADSDSINTSCNQDDYLKKFKSAVLMANSVGMTPNMIFDSNGFESAIQNENVVNFLIKKILESDRNNENYSVNLHIFGDFLSEDFFSMYSNENPFKEYFYDNTKMKQNFLFSSYGVTKEELLKDSLLKDGLIKRLDYLEQFRKKIYQATGKNIFKIKKAEAYDLREALTNKISYSLRNIQSMANEDQMYKTNYFKALQILFDLIVENKELNSRSDFYNLLKHKELQEFELALLNNIKVDIIDATYNSLFITKGEVIRFKNLNSLDNVYSHIFDDYANDGVLYKSYHLYQKFDEVKSKFELIDLALTMNPLKLLEYFENYCMDKTEEKQFSYTRKLASLIIPKVKIFGLSESKNLLLGVKT